MQPNYDLLISQMKSLERRPSDLDCEDEVQYICSLILENPNVGEHLDRFNDPVIRGVGGSGIVIRATYEPTGSHRALKFPRRRLYETIPTDSSVPEVDPELQALEKTSHQNITRLYEAFMLPNERSYCMITEYISDSEPLDKYAQLLCCNEKCRNSARALNLALRELALIFCHIADALHYMNTVPKLLHLDVKPENILLTSDGVPYVTDLGFARDLTKYKDNETVEVGFTWRYAHPRLTEIYAGARVSKVPEKAKIPLPASELRPSLDIFSFGRSLQELLGSLHVDHGEQINSLYTFNYLHVIACLCLDGRNGASRSQIDTGNCISDVAMGLPLTIFSTSKFTNFEQVLVCIQRLLGLRRFEDDLEEVDQWYGPTIKVADVGSTTLTPRVASIINHPALQRLKKEAQLGMLDSVFPTATHNRFQHTLGAYHAATRYLISLYYDPDNPVFRALVDIRKCATILVAMLVHDVGHTAYGHELEEIDDTEFSHKAYVKDILNATSFLDANGRTLRDLIEGPDDDNWGLEVEDVLNILDTTGLRSDSIDGVLRDIIDSQIDADKFDYLIRDSIECRVNYGLGIDYERFLRSLTTHPQTDGTLRLAVKQKGAASAEAFALARYQLYQSLYWHHTFGATKAMLLESVRLLWEDLRSNSQGDMFYGHPFRTAYLRNVIGVKSESFSKTSKKGRTSQRKVAAKKADKVTIDAVIESRLNNGDVGDIPTRYENDETMIFLWKLSLLRAHQLLEDLTRRRYYKRLLELSPDELSQPNWEALRLKFEKDRGKIQSIVEETLLKTLRSAIQSVSRERTSLKADETLEKLDGIASERVVFLIDIPLRGWFASSEYPVYVSDYKRRHFRAESAASGYEGRQDFWINTLGKLMKSIAFIRVFCEPNVHSIVTRVMSTQDIVNAVRTAIPDLRV